MFILIPDFEMPSVFEMFAKLDCQINNLKKNSYSTQTILNTRTYCSGPPYRVMIIIPIVNILVKYV